MGGKWLIYQEIGRKSSPLGFGFGFLNKFRHSVCTIRKNKQENRNVKNIKSLKV